jgi:hypothetical protein
VRILVELSDFNDGTNATKMSKFMYIYLGGIHSSSIQHSLYRSESFKKFEKPGLLKGPVFCPGFYTFDPMYKKNHGEVFI